MVDGAAVTISADVSDEGSTSRSWTVTGRQAGTATTHADGVPDLSVGDPVVRDTGRRVVR